MSAVGYWVGDFSDFRRRVNLNQNRPHTPHFSMSRSSLNGLGINCIRLVQPHVLATVCWLIENISIRVAYSIRRSRAIEGDLRRGSGPSILSNEKVLPHSGHGVCSNIQHPSRGQDTTPRTLRNVRFAYAIPKSTRVPIILA